MKKAVFIVLQALLLLAAYAGGVVLQVARKLPMWTSASNGGKSLFIWDGLSMLFVMLVLIFVVQAVRKTIRTNWLNPVIAFVLAMLLLAAMHFPMSRLTPTGFSGM